MLKKILCFNARDKCKTAKVPGRRACLVLSLLTRHHQLALPALRRSRSRPSKIHLLTDDMSPLLCALLNLDQIERLTAAEVRFALQSVVVFILNPT